MDEGGTPIWTTIVFAVVAVYGASLSTWEFISRRSENKRRLKISPSYGFVPYGPDTGPPMLLIQVSNVGNRVVHVQSPALLLPDGKQIIFLQPMSNVQFPHRLEEGTNCTIWMPLGELAQRLTNAGYTGKILLRTFCKDQVGEEHIGASIKFDTDEWPNRE